MSSSGQKKVLGVRRETYNAWERRAVFSPAQVRALVERGYTVLVQPSTRRAFPIQDYVAAGGVEREDLSDASVIVSVKTTPPDQLIAGKTYCFFSHTIKAQPENMPVLDALLSKKITIVDYEKMEEGGCGRPVVTSMSKWAGRAGMIDILHGLGVRLLALGHHTPFMNVGLAHNYTDLYQALTAVKLCGYEIALGKMPRCIGPMVFVFTGYGNVSRGAQEILRHLPHEFVPAADLAKAAASGDLTKVYACVVYEKDHLRRNSDGKWDADEWKTNPKGFHSVFAKEIAPHASVIVNGIFWTADNPRLVTVEDAKQLLKPVAPSADKPGEPSLPHRLLALCDISADHGGSMEFMQECTQMDRPFYVYHADTQKCDWGLDAPTGLLVCSIDNMPAQMAAGATEDFGDMFMPYIDEIFKLDPTKDFESQNIDPVVKNAVITANGQLTPRYKYITELRKAAGV